MTTREERGQAIAETCELTRKGKVWLVPSQSGAGKYTVSPDAEQPYCSCPDFETRGIACKHIHAVQFKMAHVERNDDGSTTVTTLSVVAERKTYKQNWPAYNAAQTNERRHFLPLLADLCDAIPQQPTPDRSKGGRPTIPVRDAMFAACLKVFSLTSARRFNGELEEAHDAGFLSRMPHFNSVLNVFDKEETTTILKGMIEASALPLSSVEKNFAVDSTGFGTGKYASWHDEKHGGVKHKCGWVKTHIATGVKTNIVTAVSIAHQDAGDSPFLPTLVQRTAKGFTIAEVSADKAYAGVRNFDAVEEAGGMFFPAFKSNATGGVGGAFEKAFHYFSFKKEEYLTHYHQRSNVESTVSMIKRKFGDSVKSKNPLAQKNEVYAKIVCHNVCVLIAEMYELGIHAIFARPEGCTKTLTLAQ
jgi:transposase/predicted nucleic acid-binding Zn finger protein